MFKKLAKFTASLTAALLMATAMAFVQSPGAVAVSTSTKQAFLDRFGPIAQKAEHKYGIPASVLLAQAIDASEWGTSSVATKAKNYFDIPCIAKTSEAEFGELARAQVGKRYVLGAEVPVSNANPTEFDCSELVQWLFGRAGHPITDLAAYQYNATSKVSGTPKVGDLVFLRNNPARSNGIGHVAVLTAPLADGDWEIVEARGSRWGVVKTTLSYWTTREYYAGLRRYSRLRLSDAATASVAGRVKSGCITIGTARYATFSSTTRSFYAAAAAIAMDDRYSAARAVLADSSRFIAEVAEVAAPSDPTGYAQRLNSLINDYGLTEYDLVPVTRALATGDPGSRVTALQYILQVKGYGTPITGRFDERTSSDISAYQRAKSLEVTGKADTATFALLTLATTEYGDSGKRVLAVNALLEGLGLPHSGTTFGSTTRTSVRTFQTRAGRTPTGVVDPNTWAMFFMALDSSQPTLTGTAELGAQLTATAGDWGPGMVDLSYRWYRGSTAIAGATAANYTVQAADVGATIKVKVTGSKSGYTTTGRVSTETEKVPTASFSSTPKPQITGTATIGGSLTAVASTWTPAAAFSYQWLRAGQAITGATSSSYQLVTADGGADLAVRVTGSRDGYQSESATSAHVPVAAN